MTDRIVRIVAAKPPIDAAGGPHVFSNFQDRANIVLIGDPGAGKSHLFEHFASLKGAAFLTVRSVLNKPASTMSQSTLFVDALDEKRSGRGDRATVDALVEKLFALDPQQVRISCRAQEWLGDTDLVSLRDYFDTKGGYVVLALDALSALERDAIVVAQEFEPGAFALEATSRHLEYLLTNPQNLLMLCRVVREKGWPNTRTQLFKDMTELLLLEHNRHKTHEGEGVYSADELKEAAGTICAARLISDVPAVCRAETSLDPDVPTYRGLGTENLDKLRAALGRRAFVTASSPEAVDYVHRTVAEFLAAGWLANRIRGGLPVGRVRALIGIDGHPAPELRGLHAWLAVLLPEHAEVLIAADPYGVLTYGDASSLSPSLRRLLLSELGRLSRSDPWFRSGSWSLPALATLAMPDMVGEFRSVLRSTSANFAHRSCVLEACARGSPLPGLQSELLSILVDDAINYAERSYALDALVRFGAGARTAVVDAYAKGLSRGGNGLRLRAEILGHLYGERFKAPDIVAHLADVLACEQDTHLGPLGRLVQEMPLDEALTILDAIGQIERKVQASAERRNALEILYLLEGGVVRVLDQAGQEVDGARLWNWLRAHRRLRGEMGAATDTLKAALTSHKSLLLAAIAHAVDQLVVDKNRWEFLPRLRQTTLHLVDEQELLEQLERCVLAAGADQAKQAFLYELTLLLSFRPSEPALQILERLQAFATDRADLGEILEKNLSCPLPAWREKDAQRRAERAAKTLERRQRDRSEFAENKSAIQQGADLEWMRWLAELYLGRFGNTGKSATPRERLAAEVGDENVQVAIDGLLAVLHRPDLPSFDTVLSTLADDQYFQWWLAIIAGLDETSDQQLDISTISTDLLKSALAIGTDLLIFSGERDKRRTWKRTFLEEHADLAKDAYLALARAKLASGKEHVSGLHELLCDERLAPFRRSTSLQLLREFPNSSCSVLEDILQGALAAGAPRTDFLALMSEVLDGKLGNIDATQRQLWLVAAYLLDPDRYESEISAANDRALVWRLRDLSGTDRRRRGRTEHSLTVRQLAFISGFAANHFPNAEHPSESEGNQNAWDAAEFVRYLVSQIANDPTAEATDALVALQQAPALDSYAHHLKHALASQRARRRDAEYRQPDWKETIEALKNGAPAGSGDLHALLMAHLEDAKQHIVGNNADVFKQFWNEDRHRRVTSPKTEESCRDVLLTLLRPSLLLLGIALEPEGHMASEKRADMVALHGGVKCVCELKRDGHADLWTAVDNQLERFYTRDSDASGYGIYVVFWFGAKRKGAVPLGPQGERPTSAAELEQMLRAAVADDKKARIAVIVLDVSGVGHV